MRKLLLSPVQLYALLTTDPELPRDVADRIYKRAMDANIHKTPPTEAWRLLIRTVRKVRTNALSNEASWKDMRPFYEEYIQLLDAVLARIDKARHTEDPKTGFTYTLPGWSAARTKPENGLCDHRWQTWIPTRVARDFMSRVNIARQGRVGRRPSFFWSAADQKEFVAKAQKHRNTIRRIRQEMSTFGRVDGPNSVSDSYYGALWLAAARMAELQLNRLENPESTHIAAPMWERVMPVNWWALLDAPMRTRLRQAKADPAGVDPEGLHSFYERLSNANMEAIEQRVHALTDLTDNDTEEDTDTDTDTDDQP